MWSSMLITADFLTKIAASIGNRLNITVLEVLKGSKFSGLFLTLALTGSLGTAVTVLLLGWIWPEAKSGC